MTKKAVSIARLKTTISEPDSIVPEKIKKIDISSTNQTPKLLRIIAAKRSHIPLTVTTVDPKETITEELKEEFIPITNQHVDHEEIPEEKVVPHESILAEIAKKIKEEELIAPEIGVAEVEISIEDTPEDIVDIPKDITDENKIIKEMDEASEIYVACPQKKLEEEPRKSISCKCISPSEPKDPSRLTAKCTTIDVLCPQKKPEEESPESISCKRELFSDLNKCPCSIAKYAKCKNTLGNSFCKSNEPEQRKTLCAYCRLSTAQCTCAPTQYLKSCLKTDKPRFRSMSPLNISSRYCVNCCGLKEECMNCCRIKDECRKTEFHCQLREECKCCTMRNNCSRIDKCRYVRTYVRSSCGEVLCEIRDIYKYRNIYLVRSLKKYFT